MTRLKAFTLIELLIVVAIIGILAAIAVPNFMNARIRAHVAKSQADINAITGAVMTYRIDNNAIPPRLIESGSTGSGSIGPTFVPQCRYLTTPIMYFNIEQGRSPFNQKDAQIPNGYWYYNWEEVQNRNLAVTMSWNAPGPKVWMRWMVSTIGPCTQIYPYQTLSGESGGTHLFFMDYDPSNGVVSPGLIQQHGY